MGEKSISIPSLSCYILLTTLHIISFSQLSYSQINNSNNNNNNSNNNDNDNSNSNGNINITSILSKYPELSDFNHLLSSTDIPSEVLHRSSLTILAVPNTLLRLRLSLLPPSSSLPDILRFHILLQFLSYPDLLHLPPSGSLFSTLLQTSGDHPSATLNLTHHLIFTTSTSSNTTTTTNNNDSMSSSMSSSASASASASATILSSILSLPYNLSIFSISSLLIPPTTTSLSASQTRPPLSLNITRVLLDAHNFNVAASMLTASGVSDEFLADERGAGITIFVPTDLAFSQLPLSSLRLQSLPADRKAVVLKYHVLHSYYPLGSLESIVNPVQPTLATESTGAGTFTLNITRLNGSVAIDTGIVLASITQTVFDQNPVAIFAVSKVLLPKDVFADHLLLDAPPPQFLAPSPDFHLPPTRLVAPPSLSGEIHSTHRSSGHASSSSSPLLLLLILLFQYIMLRLFFSV